MSDPSDADPSDIVLLDLPLSHRHASTVRVVSAALAADAGFTVDEIDDLRLGVSEAVSVLADVDASETARLMLRFELDGSTIRVVAGRTGVAEIISIDDVDTLAVRILTAVVDEFRVDDDGSLIVVKHAGNDVD